MPLQTDVILSDLSATATQMTLHARQRAAQRGLSADLIDLILDHADMELPAGGGRVALRLSRSRAIGLAAEGAAPIDLISRALGTEVILGDGAAVITAYRVDRRAPVRRFGRRR